MSQDWRTSLFSCLSQTDLCLDVCCCWPCMTSRIYVSATEKTNDTFSCFHCICGGPLVMLYSCMIRRKIAENFNLDEGIIGACFKGCLCFPCSLCQSHKELTAHDNWPGGSCMVNQPVQPQ